MTEQEQLARASHAQQLRENPLLTEALTAWTHELTQVWQNSQLKDADGREKLYQMLTAAKQFQTYLQNTVDSGKLITAASQGLYSTRGPV